MSVAARVAAAENADSPGGDQQSNKRDKDDSGKCRAYDRQASEGELSGRDKKSVVMGAAQKESIQWVVPRHHLAPRKVVVRSLEVLDCKDSPERPGMMFESTLKDMCDRFDMVFGTPGGSERRGQKVASVLDHLRKHTRRRRGEQVLQDGYLEWEQTSRIYELFGTDLNIFERIFFTIDVGESSSVLSKFCSFFLIFMIFVSIVTWMVSTLPTVQAIAFNCTSEKAGDCAPEPHEAFKLIESICVITFTIEYLIRLLSVHSVRFALLDEHFLEAVLTGTNLKEINGKKPGPEDGTGVSRSMSEPGTHPQALDGKLKTTFNHVRALPNVIDFMAILPFWLGVFNLQGGGGFLVVLRILRLTRIFRVFKLGKYNDVFTLFTRVVQQSMPALLLMLFFIALGCCLFGTLVWFAEQGTWHPEGNPDLVPLGIVGRGAYLRHTGGKDANSWQESPFQSIIHSFWYVVVTITTVGYGDICPTTPVGKVVASVAILNGIIVLAMPIGVVGANFSSEYYKVIEDKKRRQRMKQQLDTQAVLEKQEDEALTLNEEHGGQTQSSSMETETATELLRVDVARSLMLGEAEGLDKNWQGVLPEVLYGELSDSLRFFVLSFIIPELTAPEKACTAKPRIQMARLLELDELSTHVTTAISTVTSPDELNEFGLKEALDLRRSWFKFYDSCWEYATKMCLIEKRQNAPEYFQMKAKLAMKVATRGSVMASSSGDNQTRHTIGTFPSLSTRAVGSTLQGTAFPTISEGICESPGENGIFPPAPPDREGSSSRPDSLGRQSPSPPPTPPQVLGRPDGMEASLSEGAPEVTGPGIPGPDQIEERPPSHARLPGMPEGSHSQKALEPSSDQGMKPQEQQDMLS